MLPTTAIPPDPRREPTLFHLSEIPCRAAILLTPDGSQHLLFHDAGQALQLVVSGASLFGPIRLLTDAVFDRQNVRARLAALECLNDVRAIGKLPIRLLPEERRGQRLRLVLQALDGWLAGASYRDIAVALFGNARVEADWADPRDHLRDRVRRAIRRGRVLMDGGYRTFLS